jgi:hypothetical protein
MSGSDNQKIRVGARTYTLLLCNEGKRLRDKWTALMRNHAGPGEIYLAMQAYFYHKNGLSRESEPEIAPCRTCRMVAGDSVELFEEG